MLIVNNRLWISVTIVITWVWIGYETLRLYILQLFIIILSQWFIHVVIKGMFYLVWVRDDRVKVVDAANLPRRCLDVVMILKCILTCYTARCQATKCVPMVHTTPLLHHTPGDPIWTCGLPIPKETSLVYMESLYLIFHTFLLGLHG